MKEIEVLVIGSGGTWVKAESLDAAYEKAAGYGGLGKQVVIVVALKESGIYVDRYGSVCWQGIRTHEYVSPNPGTTKFAWPNRRTKKMRSALDEVIEVMSSNVH